MNIGTPRKRIVTWNLRDIMSWDVYWDGKVGHLLTDMAEADVNVSTMINPHTSTVTMLVLAGGQEYELDQIQLVCIVETQMEEEE